MCIECWLPKAKTHSEYVKLTAFPQPKWLHERPQYNIIRTLPVFYH
jgi:hypothetical protein